MTLLLGHPLVGAPMAMTTGFGLYVAYEVGNSGVGLICAVLLAAVGNAYQEASTYRVWAKALKAMSADSPARRPVKLVHLAVLTIMAALVAACVINPVALLAAGPGIGVIVSGLLAAAVLYRLMRWMLLRQRGHASAKPFLVAVIAKPTTAQPTLASAYKALPPHCTAILRGPQ